MSNSIDLESFDQLLLDGEYDGVVEALEFRASDPAVQAWLSKIHPGEAAQVIRRVSPSLRTSALQSMEPKIAAKVLEDLPDDVAAKTVASMDLGIAALIVQEMHTDEEVDLLQDLEPSLAKAILEIVDADDADIARRLMRYGRDTAGGLMQTELIIVPRVLCAGDAVRQLRDRSDLYSEYPATYLYVVDEVGRLAGVISMRDLVLCKPDTALADIMIDNVRSFRAGQHASELLKAFRKYRFMAIPVVDAEGLPVGVVTQDDAMRLAEEQADQELLQLTGIVGGEELRDMPFLSRSWRRISWLTVNVVLNIIAASVIAMHQETLRAVIALAVFLPIISDMSGCAGNQAVAVSIRELSLERIRPRDVLWVWRKEFSIGLLNGLILGLICGVIGWLWQGNLWLGAIVGMAMWINTLVAVTIGGLVPLVLRKFGRDPALAAGPILTTLTDACGFLVVLGLASRYIEYLI